MSPTNQLTQMRQAQQSGIVRKGAGPDMERVEALFAGGRQGMSEVKDQMATLVQAAKDGDISAAEFYDQLTGIADSALQSGSGATEKAQALHFIAHIAMMESKGTQSMAEAGSANELIMGWMTDYAEANGISLEEPSHRPPQGPPPTALISGGEEGLSKLQEQLSSLIQSLSDGTVSADNFTEELAEIADEAIKDDLTDEQKAQALHFISRLAHDTSRSLTSPADNAAPEQTMEQLILDWTRGYAQEHNLSLNQPLRIPQGMLVDGKA